ncbi:hypothetical protein B0H67DRAFT_209273 [Lasiosphaeris hirsuta]|uniref:Uncharacterized protein n=1 Tax=Lasiosphaeris hirsuta TaxID=260670 RepID=A0AA40AS35_9PEZI|nr:hypothetical protein B0H67DRAFT_209273 [Lasiosphaeris hirsuta]
MLHFVDDISPPTEPVQDYLTEVDTRCVLFDEFRVIRQYHGTVSNATVFAMFMIAPLLEIRNFLQIVRDSSLPNIFVCGTLRVAPGRIRAYLPKSRSPEGVAGPLGAVLTVIFSEPGILIPSSSVTRSGFSNRVSFRYIFLDNVIV